MGVRDLQGPRGYLLGPNLAELIQSAVNTTPMRVLLDQTRRQFLIVRSLSNMILNVARTCSFVGSSIPAPSSEMLNTRQRWLPPSPKMYATKSTSERSIFRRSDMITYP